MDDTPVLVSFPALTRPRRFALPHISEVFDHGHLGLWFVAQGREMQNIMVERVW
jgi:hypothetical protein